MNYGQYLRQLLRPLGVYDVDAPIQGGELDTLGQAFDAIEQRLDDIQRESCLATAEDWGLERFAQLFRLRPVAHKPQALRRALAALMRIGGDSFTLSAINDTISGCGVTAQVDETDRPNYVVVSFPKIPGIPPGFEEIRLIIEDILPPHLDIHYHYWFITWALLAKKLPTWRSIEEKGLTWGQLETYVDESDGL